MIALLLVLFVLIGLAAADEEKKEEQHENDSACNNPTTLEEYSLKFNFEQSVSGTGFFAAYKRAQMPDILERKGDCSMALNPRIRHMAAAELMQTRLYTPRAHTAIKPGLMALSMKMGKKLRMKKRQPARFR